MADSPISASGHVTEISMTSAMHGSTRDGVRRPGSSCGAVAAVNSSGSGSPESGWRRRNSHAGDKTTVLGQLHRESRASTQTLRTMEAASREEASQEAHGFCRWKAGDWLALPSTLLHNG